jgi:hypothetical protein
LRFGVLITMSALVFGFDLYTIGDPVSVNE